jgi:hypothetical protein
MQLHANATGLGTVSAQSLIAAPGTGVRITVVGLTVGVLTTACRVTLAFSNGNQKFFDLAPGQTVPLGQLRWEGDPNAGLTITTSAGSSGNADVSVDYVLETANA